MQPDWRPRVRPDLLCETIDDDLVVLVPETDHVHLLNLTAAAVCELCDGNHSVAQIVDALRGAVAHPTDAIAHDVDTLLAELSRKGVVE